MLEAVFSELGLSDITHRVYAHLLENGPSTARQAAERLGIPRPSVYNHLNILIRSGLVAESDRDNTKLFAVTDPQNVPRLIADKMEALGRKKREVELILPTLSRQAQSIEPKIKFYSGAEGIRQILKDMLWYKDIETYTMWPIAEMVGILGAEYLADLNRKRIRQRISIKGVWPRGKAVKLREYPFLGVGKGHLRELRLAPKRCGWDMSYWIYTDKVAFISSKKEGFGFIVHSRDFAGLQKVQFDEMWRVSDPIKPEPKYTDAFLETV